MSMVHGFGADARYYPEFGPWGYDANEYTFTAGTMDAAGEKIHFCGILNIEGRPSGAKTLSSAGGELRVGFGSCTFAAAAGATVVRGGIQDVAVGSPSRGDGTFDVYDDLVSATDTITSDAFKVIIMSSGSKSMSHGDLIAIVLDMTARGGADSVAVRSVSQNDTPRFWPQSVQEAPASTFATTGRFPNIIIKFDDGTLGWLEGTIPVVQSNTSITYDLNSTPDELGNSIRVAAPCYAYGLWAYFNPSVANGLVEMILYQDALGTPVALKTLNVDHDYRRASGAQFWQASFNQPQLLSPGVEYAFAMRPTTADGMVAYFQTVSNAAHWKCLPGGEECCYVARTGNTGAFTKTTTGRIFGGVLLGGGNDLHGHRADHQLGM